MINVRNLDFVHSAISDKELGSGRIENLLEVIHKIENDKNFQDWLDAWEIKHPNDPSIRFGLKEHFEEVLTSKDHLILEYYHLINGPFIEAKFERISLTEQDKTKTVITDAPWGNRANRVYPYYDESKILANYVREHGYDKQADVLVDPACGCGHHQLFLDNIKFTCSFDKNLRAALFASINTLLNRTGQSPAYKHDIHDGFPDFIYKLKKKTKALFVVNMPFVLFPETDGPMVQYGGRRGIALTIEFLKQLQALSEKRPDYTMRAVVLFYSLGSEKGGWQIEKETEELFPNAKRQITILRDENMWRVNGVKKCSNPMPVDEMLLKADCDLTYYTKKEADRARSKYVELAEKLKADGDTHMAFGILDLAIGDA